MNAGPSHHSIIELENVIITFRKENIIQVYFKNHLFSYSENVKIFHLIKDMSPWLIAPILICGEDYYNHDMKSKHFFASEELKKKFTAVAFFANNFAQKMVIQHFIQKHKPKTSTRFFYSEEEAIDWLVGFDASET
ncbi:DUF7793 family protein [Aurantibacillus circumpalustris]|uniref:DUF7793 family protein n=1 Tax=Aurantibacillus circumpalustris TaxID=3036359 RepID=UPI00295B7199|nr:hypothetical protein [Aurantibacillus circumpalustris]